MWFGPLEYEACLVQGWRAAEGILGASEELARRGVPVRLPRLPAVPAPELSRAQ